MERVQVSGPAQDDLNEIWCSIAVNNVAAANRFSERIEALLQKLLQFPRMGMEREEIGPGVRSFPCGDYLVMYRPEPYGIDVRRVVYGGRNFDTLDYSQ